MRDRGAAGGFALEGTGADGRGDWYFTRVHRGASAEKAAEGHAHRVRENYRDRDGKYFDGGGAGRWGDSPGECGAGARSDGLDSDVAEDGSANRGRWNLDAADSRSGAIARDGTHRDSGPDRGRDFSRCRGNYGRRPDYYELRSGTSGRGDCETGAGWRAD